MELIQENYWNATDSTPEVADGSGRVDAVHSDNTWAGWVNLPDRAGHGDLLHFGVEVEQVCVGAGASVAQSLAGVQVRVASRDQSQAVVGLSKGFRSIDCEYELAGGKRSGKVRKAKGATHSMLYVY